MVSKMWYTFHINKNIQNNKYITLKFDKYSLFIKKYIAFGLLPWGISDSVLSIEVTVPPCLATIKKCLHSRCFLRVAHHTVHSAHCTLQNADYILHTAHFTLHCKLHTAHCTMHNAHFRLQNANGTLHTTQFTLHTTQCTVLTAPCTLHTANCTLHTSHGKMWMAHCTLHTAPFEYWELGLLPFWD